MHLLREWAKAKLACDSWKDALLSAVSVSISFCSRIHGGIVIYVSKFVVSRATTYRVICEHLETIGHTTDASECFRQLVVELTEGKSSPDDHLEWILGEGSCITCMHRQLNGCSGKLKSLGDPTMSIERHDDIIFRCSDALSLNPTTPQNLLIQRSKAYVAKGLLQEALYDANKVRCLVSRMLVLFNRVLPGNRARSSVSMGLREEICRITQGRRLSKRNQSIRGDALEDDTVV